MKPKTDLKGNYPLRVGAQVKTIDDLIEIQKAIESPKSMRMLTFFTHEVTPGSTLKLSDIFEPNSSIHELKIEPRYAGAPKEGKYVKYYAITVSSTQSELEKIETKIDTILKKDKELSSTYMDSIAGTVLE